MRLLLHLTMANRQRTKRNKWKIELSCSKHSNEWWEEGDAHMSLTLSLALVPPFSAFFEKQWASINDCNHSQHFCRPQSTPQLTTTPVLVSSTDIAGKWKCTGDTCCQGNKYSSTCSIHQRYNWISNMSTIEKSTNWNEKESRTNGESGNLVIIVTMGSLTRSGNWYNVDKVGW